MRSTRRSAPALALIALMLGGSACRGVEPEPPAQAQPAKAQPDAPAAYEVVPVVAAVLETSARLTGELSAEEAVALYPRVSAFVEAMLVDRGTEVHRGQLLARLSAPELLAQQAEAESKLVAARSTYERTRSAAETPGAVAKHDIEVAEATLNAEQARVQALGTLASYLSVRAPFDGVITERNVHPGALVGPPSGANATPMLRLAAIDPLRLTVAVPEIDAGAIVAGARTEFSVRSWPGVRFAGQIARVAHTIDAHTRTMPVEIDVPNKDRRLAPGMFADVDWPVRRAAPSLFVPPSAVAQTTERTYVDRVRDGTIEIVRVRRGMAWNDKIEVYGELAAGDLVLRRGSEELRDGAHVETRAAAPPDGGVAR